MRRYSRAQYDSRDDEDLQRLLEENDDLHRQVEDLRAAKESEFLAKQDEINELKQRLAEGRDAITREQANAAAAADELRRLNARYEDAMKEVDRCVWSP